MKLLFEELCNSVIGAAIGVHRELGPGFLESVYERALCYELAARHIPFERQVQIAVWYKSQPAGIYRADLMVDGKIIVEIKAVNLLTKDHVGQAVHYLKSTGFRLALLLNFGGKVLGIKRVIS